MRYKIKTKVRFAWMWPVQVEDGNYVLGWGELPWYQIVNILLVPFLRGSGKLVIKRVRGGSWR